MSRQERSKWVRIALIEVGVLAVGLAVVAVLALGIDDATRALLRFGSY